MSHVRGNASVGQEFTFLAHGPTIWFVLDDFHGMAVGVENVEIRISDLALSYFLRHLNSSRSKVIAHPLGGVSIERDVVKMAILPGRFRKELKILIVVDFDKSDTVGAVFALQHVGLVVAKKIFIKRARLG